MTKKKSGTPEEPQAPSTESPAEDRRVPEDEQPIALAVAEETGVLPAEDRRHEDVAAAAQSMEHQITADQELANAVRSYLNLHTIEEVAAFHRTLSAIDQQTPAILEASGIGSTFTKTSAGWRITYIAEGGKQLFVSGATMAEALDGHGLHRTHDSTGIEHAAVTGPQHAEMIVQ